MKASVYPMEVDVFADGYYVFIANTMLNRISQL